MAREIQTHLSTSKCRAPPKIPVAVQFIVHVTFVHAPGAINCAATDRVKRVLFPLLCLYRPPYNFINLNQRNTMLFSNPLALIVLRVHTDNLATQLLHFH